MPLLLLLGVAVSLSGCASSGTTAKAETAHSMQCSSLASAMLYQSQLEGFPKYITMGTSGSYDREELNSTGRLEQVTFASLPMVDNCQVLRTSGPYDNPQVDLYRKRNRLVLAMTDPDTGRTSKSEYRWQGGLIVTISYLWHLEEPVIGIEEVDPDGTITRRILYLDGRKRALEYHRGTFPEPPSGPNNVPAPKRPFSARVSLV